MSGFASLEVEGLEKTFFPPSGPLTVLKRLSFKLLPGESLVVQGPSGSGKTTLLNILGLMDAPTDGSICLGGEEITTLSGDVASRFRARNIGFLFQEHHLLGQCTALENVLLAPLALGRVGKEDVVRAESLLEGVGLKDFMDFIPSRLSGGQRQRVALARALMNNPALILADEPTGALDRSMALRIGEILVSLLEDKAGVLVLATHDTTLASLFPRVCNLEAGLLKGAHEA